MSHRLRLAPLVAALTLMTVLVLTSGCDSGSSGDGSDICGCTGATAEDLTAQTSVTVAFGGSLGSAYAPRCVLVAPGTTVSFEGAFATHPLSATVGAGNPITPTASGTTAAFTFPQAGAYGYQCDLHVASGMCGAVYVQ